MALPPDHPAAVESDPGRAHRNACWRESILYGLLGGSAVGIGFGLLMIPVSYAIDRPDPGGRALTSFLVATSVGAVIGGLTGTLTALKRCHD